jgi:hypothetical protein
LTARQWQNDRMAEGTLVCHFGSISVWQYDRMAEGTLAHHIGSKLVRQWQYDRMEEGTLVRHFGSMAAGAVSEVESGPNLPGRGASLQPTNKGPLKYTYIFTYFHIQILC